MSLKVKPVSQDEQFTTIDHLDELRQRLFICIAGFLVCFAVAAWQQQPILKVLNNPLSKVSRQGDSLQDNDVNIKQVEIFQQINISLHEFAKSQNRNQTEQRTATINKQLEKLSRLVDQSTRISSRKKSELRPITLGVAEPFTVSINIAFYIALIAVSPLVLTQLYAFVLPAFTAQERRSALPIMFAAPMLFIAGIAFAYFLVLPRAIIFLQQFNSEAFLSFVQAREYYRFVLLFLGGIGLLFEIPIAVLALTNIVGIDPKLLQRNRGIAVLLFAIIAAVLTPTPDPVTMLLALAPLVVLYELSLWLVRSKDRGKRKTKITA